MLLEILVMKPDNRRNILKSMGAATMLPLLASHLVQAQSVDPDGGVGPDTVYELRVYHLHPGIQPKILDRFRTKEVTIFKRLGMQPIAYWVATEGPALLSGGGGTLIYILRHHSREAAAASWARFVADPEWMALKTETEKNGPFVASQEHTFMKLTDFSPIV